MNAMVDMSRYERARQERQYHMLAQNHAIKYLTGKIREGHMMEFGIELEWAERWKPAWFY